MHCFPQDETQAGDLLANRLSAIPGASAGAHQPVGYQIADACLVALPPRASGAHDDLWTLWARAPLRKRL
eukprot:2026858-Amphidinium_carterae.1